MSVFELGRSVTDNEPVTLDVSRLVDTRMLVQAGSGGGKSWLIRRLAEHACGQVQTIIIDWEGEFVTLREAVDVLIVGKEGEVAADPRSASLLARRLMELQVSAVVDLCDLSLPDRRRFVRLFLESIMTLPKSLWRPCLIVVDEAQEFCPEKSHGEAESAASVIALCSQGRKRGYGAVLVTQRLSKLHKDAAAELKNCLIGGATIDIDLKRSLDILGEPTTPANKKKLRDLHPGEFFGFGPAFASRDVRDFRVGPVKSSHPEAGRRHMIRAPQPSQAIRSVIGELADLQQAAEQETNDLESARDRIAELERQLRDRPTAEPIVERIEVPTLPYGEFENDLQRMTSACQTISLRLDSWKQRQGTTLPVKEDVPPARLDPNGATPPLGTYTATGVMHHKIAKEAAAEQGVGSGDSGLSKMERAMLTAMAQHPRGLTKSQILLHADYTACGKTSTTFAKFAAMDWMRGEGGVFTITQGGRLALGRFKPLPVGAAMRELLLSDQSKLDTMEKALLGVLFKRYPGAVPKGKILEEADYTACGKTSTAFARLARLGYAVKHKGALAASPDLFPDRR